MISFDKDKNGISAMIFKDGSNGILIMIRKAFNDSKNVIQSKQWHVAMT